MSIVVTDTGPLLHLHQAVAANLIANFGTVHITPQVWLEFQWQALKSIPWRFGLRLRRALQEFRCACVCLARS